MASTTSSRSVPLNPTSLASGTPVTDATLEAETPHDERIMSLLGERGIEEIQQKFLKFWVDELRSRLSADAWALCAEDVGANMLVTARGTSNQVCDIHLDVWVSHGEGQATYLEPHVLPWLTVKYKGTVSVIAPPGCSWTAELFNSCKDGSKKARFWSGTVSDGFTFAMKVTLNWMRSTLFTITAKGPDGHFQVLLRWSTE
ncbi:hypothetical protein Pelo_15870 [Pelomyxa schiedti]|nr:hypothetical protein Pelo_15870 [Pelomyxa schiedti]